MRGSLAGEVTPTGRAAPVRPLRRALALLACALVGLSGSCAKPGPPGGGPADTEPPFVVATTPAAGAVSVDRGVSVEIEFSEDMDRQSVERMVSSSPDLAFGRVRWDGRTLRLTPEEALPESRTFVFEVGAAAQDYHGVTMAATHAFAFSTGATLDRGIIEGAVSSGGDPAPRATVWACLDAAEPDTSGLMHPCGYTTSTDQEGVFRFQNVAPSTTAYTIQAFNDADSDRRYAVARETGGTLADAALVEAQSDSVTGLVIQIEPPPTIAPQVPEAGPDSLETAVPTATGAAPDSLETED